MEGDASKHDQDWTLEGSILTWKSMEDGGIGKFSHGEEIVQADGRSNV